MTHIKIKWTNYNRWYSVQLFWGLKSLAREDVLGFYLKYIISCQSLANRGGSGVRYIRLWGTAFPIIKKEQGEQLDGRSKPVPHLVVSWVDSTIHLSVISEIMSKIRKLTHIRPMLHSYRNKSIDSRERYVVSKYFTARFD